MAWSCYTCQSIDPALSVHESGSIQVGEDWKRLVIDMKHYWGMQSQWLTEGWDGMQYGRKLGQELQLNL